jgi:hypothetical protein
MSAYYIIYNGLIFVSFILSLMAFLKGHKRYLFLSILFLLTFVVEIAVEVMIKKDMDFTWLYHCYNMIEYPMIALFFIRYIKNTTAKLVVKFSMLVCFLACLALSFFHYHFMDFPGLNINIEAIFLSALCIYILFNLDTAQERPLLKSEEFWISAGILIFFGTTFFFNGVYGRLINVNTNKALEFFALINKPLNLTLYLFIIIGITCLLTNKKHLTR